MWAPRPSWSDTRARAMGSASRSMSWTGSTAASRGTRCIFQGPRANEIARKPEVTIAIRPIVLCIAVAAGAAARPADPLQDATRPAGRLQLFNQRNLDGWYTFLRDHRGDDPLHVFTVQDGTLRISGEEWGG